MLDPLFWQALGKALEWNEVCCEECGAENICHCECSDRGGESPNNIDTWLYHALRYLETLLVEGQGKADEYLASLIV